MKRIFFAIVLVFAFMLTMMSCGGRQSVIRTEIAAAKQLCPKYMGEGMTLTDLELDGSYVIYHIKYDLCSILADDPATLDIMKAAMIQSLQSQGDISAAKFVSALKEEGIGIVYHIYSDDGSSPVDIKIEADEL